MTKYCDGATRYPCPHPDECTVSCGFNDATVLRRLKPYPHVPLMTFKSVIEPDRDEGSKIARRLIVAIKVFLFLWVLLMAMSGMFLWSLLI
jgi:hypothetical protein